jgi:hypothetical protein
MGASYDDRFVPIEKAKTAQEAIAWFEREQTYARHDNGHAGYTGSIAEAHGVARAPTFATVAEARRYMDGGPDPGDESRWIDGHAEKWGPALMAHVTADPKHGSGWYFGALCSS